MTFFISFAIAFFLRVLLIFESRSKASFNIFGNSIPYLWVHFSYLACHLLTKTTITSFFMTYLIHKLRASLYSIPWTITYSFTYNGFNSFQLKCFPMKANNHFTGNRIPIKIWIFLELANLHARPDPQNL